MRWMPAEELVVTLYDCNKEGLVRVVVSDTLHKKTPPSEIVSQVMLMTLSLMMTGAPAARKKGSAGYDRVHTSRVKTHSSQESSLSTWVFDVFNSLQSL